MPDPIRVLIIDDEKVIREGCERALSGHGYEITKARDGNAGISILEKEDFQVVLLDLMMPGIDGLAVLKWIRENRPKINVIVITGFATVEKAVTAMKEGAFDFVGKPFTPDYIRIVVQRAVEKIALETETAQLREEKSLDLATIAEEQSRLRTVFTCMDEAVLVTDHKGVVLLHNPAVIEILEIQADPVIGKHLGESMRDSDALSMVEEVIRDGCTITREFEAGTISRLYLRAHCAPVRSAEGEILGSVTVYEDISTHKHIDQLKSDFVAMVAHELRAPLASIEQMIYALPYSSADGDGEAERQKKEDRRKQIFSRINIRIKELLQLIENLLNLSKLESGTIVFNLEPALGDDIISDTIQFLSPQAEARKIDLKFEQAPEEWWINADSDQIRGVFMNIIGNAIKYTPDGGAVIVASSVSSGLAKINVTDNGVGIKSEDLPNIFDRFFRSKTKATRGITGSGLGLSVVKKVIEAHNGFIVVESELDKGTTFTLSFPVADQPA